MPGCPHRNSKLPTSFSAGLSRNHSLPKIMKVSAILLALFVAFIASVTADHCPCRCLGGIQRMRRAKVQCLRPAFLDVCEVTACKRPNGGRSFQCCDVPVDPTPTPEEPTPTPEGPTPTPEAPTPTPEIPTPTPELPTPTPMPPVDCPCRCRRGRRGRRAARRMCRRAIYRGCVVTQDGCPTRGWQCCNEPMEG